MTNEQNTRLAFPDHFFWGTSTAAAQVETASDHNWKGLKANDGYIFERTTDHEKQRASDAEFIQRLGSVYRCGVDWARLQPTPNQTFEKAVVEEYQAFFQLLNDKGVRIMFVIHHFTNPVWFEHKGGWLKEENLNFFLNFADQCIHYFGEYVFNWNTFNEPNVYAMNAYLLGNFPPHKKSYFKANRVIKHMGKAHTVLYEILKNNDPDKEVGISLNTGLFEGLNTLGKLPAAFTDWWFITRAARYFKEVDYWGLSYYAYVLFDPFPITETDRPGKLKELGIAQDKMWGYRPDGLGKILRRFHKKYGKPIIITENGICSDDPQERIKALKEYLKECYEAIQEGVDLRGYIHWSTWDNFEWNLGPTYRFGLVRVNLETMERTFTKAAEFYEKITQENEITI
jgi:beta-glucosidase